MSTSIASTESDASRTPLRWNRVGMLLHWVIALLIIGLATVGLLMGDLANGPLKMTAYQLHKSTGITVLALVALRLVWRLAHRAPPPVVGTSTWQQRGTTATHVLLYAMMFVMPISGWLFSSAGNHPFKWYGLFTVPALSGPNADLKQRAIAVHEYGFYVLAALVLLHTLAALKHHFFDKDATLARMLPAGWVPDPSQSAAHIIRETR